jgi:D-tyrosyl-tRNA(Tyr) deacylase
MTAVIQRVYNATVYADGILSGSIDKGLYILLGVRSSDTEEDARVLATKISKLRIFSDENGKMNLSVLDVGGGALVVSNFTLMANYAKGNRPDHLDSAPPAMANMLYEFFIKCLKENVSRVESGVFGSDMRTEMTTDGPVTIVMNSEILIKKP